MRFMRWVTMLVAAGMVGAAFGGDRPLVLTPPAFRLEIGPGTTWVTGPVGADGTIDYAAVMYERRRAGVKAEEDAYPLLVKALGEWKYMDAEQGTQEAVSLSRESRSLMGKVWKAAEHPKVATLVEANGKALDEALAAAARGKLLLPANEAAGQKVLGDMPNLELGLALRAGERIGDGDAAGGRLDVASALRLEQLVLAAAQPGSTYHTGTIAWRLVMMAARGEDAAGREAWVAALRDVREVRVDPTSADESRARMLGKVMVAVQGHPADALGKLLTFQIGVTDKIMFREEDLAAVDWNVVLRMINQASDDAAKALAEPEERRTKAVSEVAKRIWGLETPAGAMEAERDMRGNGPPPDPPEEIRSRLEAFLVQRPGESQEAYSRRIAGYFVKPVAGDLEAEASQASRIAIEQREHMLALGVLAYQAKQGELPKTLEDLSDLAGFNRDPYGHGGFLFRSDADGFSVYSVGENGRDDGGRSELTQAGNGPDDIAVRVSYKGEAEEP